MNKFSPVSLIAGAAELVASAGAGMVVGNLVKATTPDDLNKFQKVILAVGSYTVGGVLSDLSSKYVRSQIESYSEKVTSLFHSEEEAEATEVLVIPTEPTVVEAAENAIEAVEEIEKPVKKVTKPKTTKKDSE